MGGAYLPGLEASDFFFLGGVVLGRERTDTGIPKLLNIGTPIPLYLIRHLNQHDVMGTGVLLAKGWQQANVFSGRLIHAEE